MRADVDNFHAAQANQNTDLKTRVLTKGSNSSAPTSKIHPKSNKILDKSETDRRKRVYNGFGFRALQRPVVDDIHKTLSLCGLGVIDNPDGGPGTGRFSCDHETGAVHQTGIMTCHSPWACPVCAPKVAASRAMALKPQIEWRVRDGWSVSLLTLTVRHQRKTSIDAMFQALTKAWAKVTSGRWWDNLRKRGLVDFVRGYDCTWSERHGWHPHLHVCLMLDKNHEEEEVCEEILRRWRGALARLGWSTTREGQHFDRADDPEKAARYAVTPAAVYESLAMAMKRARGKSSGLTPFEILERAVADVREAVKGSRWIALWRDYVAATKGRRQAVTSQGLDLEHTPEDTDGSVDAVLEVGPEALKRMDQANLVPKILETIEDYIGDPDAMRTQLHRVMSVIKDAWWKIPDFDHSKPKFRIRPDAWDLQAIPVPPEIVDRHHSKLGQMAI